MTRVWPRTPLPFTPLDCDSISWRMELASRKQPRNKKSSPPPAQPRRTRRISTGRKAYFLQQPGELALDFVIVSDEIDGQDRSDREDKSQSPRPNSGLMCFKVNPKDAMTRENSLICARLIEEIRLARKPLPRR